MFRNPPIVLRIERTDRNSTLRTYSMPENQSKKVWAYRAPLATANLSSLGLHLTKVADLLMRSRTRVGFQISFPVSRSGVSCQTYAFLSWDAVTMRLEAGAQSMEVISLSCCGNNLLEILKTHSQRDTRLRQRLCRSPFGSRTRKNLYIVGVQAHGDICKT